MYISITGLKPKSFLSSLQFWRFAIPSFTQAKKAKGIIFCEVKRIKGFQCTLTAEAMKSFHKIATGKTYGYESNVIPDWTEAFRLLELHGKEY